MLLVDDGDNQDTAVVSWGPHILRWTLRPHVTIFLDNLLVHGPNPVNMTSVEA